VPYRYFVCSTRHLRQKCEAPYLRAGAVEEAVARYYATVVRLDAERVSAFEAELAEAFNTVSDYIKQQLDTERRLVDRLEAERRRLLDAYCPRTCSPRSRINWCPKSPMRVSG